jgi:predicted phosphoribosyltransferase
MFFKNRQEAGQLLAEYLEKVLNIENPQNWIILFIPR